ncbi:MAG: XrtA/PEP-CTERM system TPR-repeat protein PrsT [Gammaproteobacteria bacterium]
MRPDSHNGRPLRATAIAAAAVLAGACDAFLGVEDRLDRAAAALAGGDYVAAMTEAKSAVEKEPDHAGARLLLAEVMLQFGDAATARVELDRAQQLGTEPDARLRYRILLGQGRHEELIESLAADVSLDDQARLQLIAEAELAQDDAERALATIRQARQRDAEDDDAAFLEVRALWQAGHQQEALSALGRLHRRNPEQARWWLYRGRYLLSLGQPEPARDAFAKAGAAPQATLDFLEQVGAIAGLAESNLAAGDVAAAEQALAKMQQRAPGAFGTLFLRGRIALARRDYVAATADLQRALAERPGMPFARLLLGASLLHQGLLEQADVEFSQLLAEQPDNADARNLLASVYVARNDIESARRVLAAAPAGAAAHPATGWMMGGLMLRAGQSAEAIGMLEASVAMDPDNSALQLDLVRAYLSAGEPEKARRLLATLPDEQGGLERRHLTVVATTRGLDPDEAGKGVTAYAAGRPDDAAAQAAAGAYFLAVGDLATAEPAFVRAVELAPASAEGRLGLAAIALRKGDAKGAETVLRQGLAAQGGDQRVLIALSEVALARHDRAAARQWLEQAIGSDPASVEPRLRLAELGFADKDPLRAQSLLEQALEVALDDGTVHHRIAGIHVRQADYDRALVHFNQAATRGVPGAALDAVRALIALGREDEARSRLEQEIRRDPKAAMPVAMIAALDAADRRLERALERVAALERGGGAPAAAAEIRGDLFAMSGRPAEAAQGYARAAQLRPNEMLAIKEFYARVSAGEKAPESPLQRWLDHNPRSAGARYLLAERHHRVGRRAEAIAEYERVLQSGPHAFALNNLALLYQESGDRRVVATARRAFEMSPANPAIADTYGWILVQQGQTTEGLRVLAAAMEGAPSHPDIRYHHAAAQARVGHENEAAVNLRALLESAPEFESRREAERLLAALDGG